MKKQRKKSVWIVVWISILILLSGCGAKSSAPEYVGTPTQEQAKQDSAVEYGYEDNASLQKAEQTGETKNQITLMIIKNASFSLQVKDLSKVSTVITDEVLSIGGFIEHAELNDDGQDASAMIVCRIPSIHFESFIQEMGTLGRIRNKTVTAQNVTEEYYDNESHIKTMEKEEEILRGFLEKTGTIDEMLKVERELGRVRGEMEVLKGRNQYLSALVSLSKVEIYLRQVRETNIYVDPQEEMGTMEKAWEGILYSMRSILRMVKGFIIVMGYLFPYLLIAGVVLGISYKILKRKSKKPPHEGE